MSLNREFTLEQLGSFEKSYSFSRALEGNGEYRHIHYGDIHTKLPSVILNSDILPSIIEEQHFDTIEYGDIIIADASEDYKDLGKAVCFLDPTDSKVISGLHTHRFRPNSNLVKPEYLINLFQTNRYRKFVWKMGTGISVLGLSKTNLAKYTLALPNLEDQEKIAEYFINLNKKIQLQQEKIDLLKAQKKGYTQKLFKQEMRFKDAKGHAYPDWTLQIKAEQLFEPISNKNHNSDFHVLSASQEHGMVYRHSLDRQMSFNDDNLGSYKLVEPKDFIISLRSFQGGIEFSNLQGLVSPAYTVFRKKSDMVHELYFAKVFKTENFIMRLNATTYGIRDGKAISYKDFSTLKFDIPCLEEQIKIANFLDTFDKKIAHETTKIIQLTSQKQAFMQQMFI